MDGFRRKPPNAPLRPCRFARRAFMDDLDRAFLEATRRAKIPRVETDMCLLAVGESVDDSPPPSRPDTPVPFRDPVTAVATRVGIPFGEDDEPLSPLCDPDEEVESITASTVEELPTCPCTYCGDQTNGGEASCALVASRS